MRSPKNRLFLSTSLDNFRTHGRTLEALPVLTRHLWFDGWPAEGSYPRQERTPVVAERQRTQFSNQGRPHCVFSSRDPSWCPCRCVTWRRDFRPSLPYTRWTYRYGGGTCIDVCPRHVHIHGHDHACRLDQIHLYRRENACVIDVCTDMCTG